MIDDHWLATGADFIANRRLDLEFATRQEPKRDIIADRASNPTVFGVRARRRRIQCPSSCRRPQEWTQPRRCGLRKRYPRLRPRPDLMLQRCLPKPPRADLHFRQRTFRSPARPAQIFRSGIRPHSPSEPPRKAGVRRLPATNAVG